MSSGPAAPGPRLVYDANATAPAAAGPARRRVPWLAVLLLVAALLAAWQWRRAADLQTRVDALSAALATARAEIAARRQQLDAIRASVDDVRERVAGLAALAAEEPAPPPAPPAASAPAH